MNAELERWYQQANLDRDPKLLKQRRQLVTEVLRGLKPQATLELVRLHLGLPSYDRASIGKLFDGVKDQGPSYARPEISQELRILAGAALTEVMTNAQKGEASRQADLIAASILCATGPDSESRVFPTLFGLCHRHYALRTTQRNSVVIKATRERNRIQLDKVKIPEAISAKIMLLSQHPHQGQAWVNCDLPTIDSINKSLSSVEHTLNNAVAAVDELAQKIDTSLDQSLKLLPQQLLLIREESDILWWLYGETSNDFKQPFSKIELSTLCILVAKELADLTQVVPGPYSALGFLDKSIHMGRAELPDRLAIATVMETLPSDWRLHLAQTLLPELADLSPVLRSVKRASAGSAIDALEFSPLGLAHQLYQELMLSRQWREVGRSEEL